MSNQLRSILFLTVGFSLFVRTDALAFDFVSNLQLPVDTFRFLDQPSQRLNSVQAIMLPIVPTRVGRTAPLPLNEKRPAKLTGGSNAAFWQAMESIHTRIDSLSWKQRASDQSDGQNQDGFLRALGLKRVTAADRFAAETLNAEQGSDANDDLAVSEDQSASSWGSQRIPGQQPFAYQGLWPGSDFGSGINVPPMRLLDQNATNTVAPTGWSATFHYADTDTKRLPLPKVQLSGRGRLGLTPTSNESLNVYLPVMLYPRTTLMGDNEWHSDGLFFGAYVEGAASSQSALVGGLTQAPSTVVTVGLKTGVNF
jgi:hypothetical protein